MADPETKPALGQQAGMAEQPDKPPVNPPDRIVEAAPEPARPAAPRTEAADSAASAEKMPPLVETGRSEAPAGSRGVNVLDLKRIHSIKVLVQAVLGGINMSVARLGALKEGEVVPLDAKIGDAIDILANGQLIARGEIVVIEGAEPRFGIQITTLENQS